MKYISSKTGGRLANQLYFVLQAYCKTQRTRIQHKYVQIDTLCPATDLTPFINRLSINEYVEHDKPIDYLLQTHNYYQYVDKDFTQYELNGFIRSTILQSSELKQLDNNDVVAIHIRNGDYLNLSAFQVFNRNEYLQKAVDQFSNCNRAVIFSDDNMLNQQLFDKLLKSKFNSIEYVSGNDEVTDLLQLATYQNKILWNSTFSYWSGFISNVLHTKTKITCPKMFMQNQTAAARVLPNWIQL